MDNKTALPKRKHPRLKDFDYGAEGVYFVTICTQDRRCLLSRIVGRGFTPAEEYEHTGSVRSVVKLTKCGEIAEKQLFLIEKRFPGVIIDTYVIMPNHIHVVFSIDTETAGARGTPKNAVAFFGDPEQAPALQLWMLFVHTNHLQHENVKR